MLCSQCGNKILVDSKFCSECGHPTLQKEDKDDTQEMVIEEQTTITEARDQEENIVEKKRWWLLALPLTALCLGVAAVALIYYIETNQNDKATAYISNAQGFALEGKWQEAIENYDKALSLHPMNKTIISEKDMISFALSVEEDIDRIREYLEEKNYEDATKLVEEVQQSLDHQNGKVIELLRAKVADESMLLTIAKIEKEIPSMNDYNDVVYNLQVLSGLPKKETEPTRHKLNEKMIEIIKAEVTSLLNNHQFSDAFAAVKKGLVHLAENDQLQLLKNEIEDKKIEFEQQEQKRIQLAKQKAAEEDLLNRTAAIEMTDIEVELDEWGYTIYGTVISKGTRPLSNIAVHYTVTDEDGSYVTESSVYTNPNILYPGESASFSMQHFGTYDYLDVQADQITWVIE